MNGEIHLFILWQKARKCEKKILDDISVNFKILQKIEIDWRDNFSSKISAFYGENLPPHSEKEKHVGVGKFLLVIVLDETPLYSIRRTSKGAKLVNINMFDSKEMYRKWTGGGHKIHASNDLVESEHDLEKILGKNLEELKEIYECNRLVKYENPYTCNNEYIHSIVRFCKRSKLIVGIYSIYYNIKRDVIKKRGLDRDRIILMDILNNAGYSEIVPIAMNDNWSVGKKAYFWANKNNKRCFIKFSSDINNTYNGIYREWDVIQYIMQNSVLLKSHIPCIYERKSENGWNYLAMQYVEKCQKEDILPDLKQISNEMLRCVQELQRLKVLHMDLGLRNIIFNKEKGFYIIDWEFARCEELVCNDSLYSQAKLPKDIENLGLFGTPQKGHFDDMYALLVLLKDLYPDFKKDYCNEWKTINEKIGDYYFKFGK